MNTLWKISILSGTAITAYLAGKYQSRIDNEPYISGVTGIPIIPKIHAATIIEKQLFKPQNIVDDQNKSITSDKTQNENAPTFKSKTSKVMQYGFPSLENIRSYDGFVLSYNRKNRIANWVLEHLTRDTVKYNKDVDRSKCEFFEDESVHPFFRSRNSDYKGSGFDRGHLAAAGNHKWNQDQCQKTFVLSNMAPQVGQGFNRDYWNQLEKHIRKLTRKYMNVYVCTGPLFLPKKESDGKLYIKYQVIGSNTVAVPTHFFKIALMETAESTFEMEAYVMPNAPISDNTPLTNFLVPLESIERAAGLLFFDNLPKERLKKINGKLIA